MTNTTNAAHGAIIRQVRSLRATLWMLDQNIAREFTTATNRAWREHGTTWGADVAVACDRVVRALYALEPQWWICEEQIAEAMTLANDIADAA